MTALQPSALSALAAGVLVAALLSVTLGWVAARRTAQRGADRSGDDRGSVTCPTCGAENDPGYRYCRGCVSELPGRSPRERHGPPTSGRLLR